ncbi:MAG: PadR family transcriptional regulator [Leptospiraceae bacterium]|nr:PadR family transcriptional regulator [Leptospiraceae bacterium]
MALLKDKYLQILGILLHEGMHGYKINQMLDFTGNSIHIGKANAYKILAKFEELGFVTQKKEAQSNFPDKNVYSITEKGKKEFNRLLRERLGETQPFEHPDGVSLNYIGLLEPKEAVSLLEKRKEALITRQAELKGPSKKILESHPGLNFLSNQVDLELDLLNKLMKNLKTKKK